MGHKLRGLFKKKKKKKKATKMTAKYRRLTSR
jgi:hypothetical protein